MELIIEGRHHSVGQLGPNFLMLDDPIPHPPGTKGTLFYSIDGNVREHQVVLPEGIDPAVRRVAIRKQSLL